MNILTIVENSLKDIPYASSRAEQPEMPTIML